MATATTHGTTVGVFQSRDAAERAVADLRAAGYRDDQIGLVAKNASGKTVRTDGAGEPVTWAWALLHALGHLREHVGHAQLTRQLL